MQFSSSRDSTGGICRIQKENNKGQDLYEILFGQLELLSSVQWAPITVRDNNPEGWLGLSIHC